MTTWGAFFESEPDLDAAAGDLGKRWAGSIARAGGTLFPDDAEVKPASLLSLLVWAELRKVEAHYAAAKEAEQAWTMLGTAHVDGVVVRYLKSAAGDLVELPEAFVKAFVAGRRLDCELRDDTNDPSWVEVVRAGKIEAAFPKGLLDHLAGLREQGTQVPGVSYIPSQRPRGRDPKQEKGS